MLRSPLVSVFVTVWPAIEAVIVFWLVTESENQSVLVRPLLDGEGRWERLADLDAFHVVLGVSRILNVVVAVVVAFIEVVAVSQWLSDSVAVLSPRVFDLDVVTVVNVVALSVSVAGLTIVRDPSNVSVTVS